MVTCLLCGLEYNKLSQHLRATHKISKEEYLEKFPGAETTSKEYSDLRRDIINNMYKTGKMDTEARALQYEEFNKKGIEYRRSEKGREESSNILKELHKREGFTEMTSQFFIKWKKENPEEFREVQKKLSMKRWSDEEQHTRMSNRLKQRWDTDKDYRDSQCQRLGKLGCQITLPHRIVSDYLSLH